MKSNWTKVKLIDVCVQITDGAHNTVYDTPGGDCFLLSCKNIKNGAVRIGEKERRIDKKTLENLRSRTKMSIGDVLISSVGTIGETAIVKEDNPPYEFQRSVAIFKPNQRYITPKFLYYSLRHKKKKLQHLAEGAVQQCLFINPLKEFEISIPTLEEQEKIVNVLSSLDNKIELNEKINQNLDWEDYFSICRKIIELEEENQNLEAQAQAIFKSWFVDFEPFGGKMPAGWGQGCLSDVLSVIESGSRPKGGSESSGVPSIGAENIDGIGHYDYSKEKYINRDFFQNLRHGKVNSGDILLYKDGAYVGKVSMALNGFPHEICAVNEHVFILRTNERLPSQSYLYLFLAQHSIRNKIATLGSAKAAQPGVNQSDIKGIALTIPNKRTIQAFENIASSLFSKIVQNSIQSRRLSQLRDTLLPKLMSGEIDVSDVAV